MGYKGQKMILNLQLRTYQVLTNDDQMLVLCLSYIMTTVLKNERNRLIEKVSASF